jgi:hypothetical protein
MTGLYHCTCLLVEMELLVEMAVLWTFCLGLLRTTIFPILPSQVARIYRHEPTEPGLDFLDHKQVRYSAPEFTYSSFYSF